MLYYSTFVDTKKTDEAVLPVEKIFSATYVYIKDSFIPISARCERSTGHWVIVCSYIPEEVFSKLPHAEGVACSSQPQPGLKRSSMADSFNLCQSGFNYLRASDAAVHRLSSDKCVQLRRDMLETRALG